MTLEQIVPVLQLSIGPVIVISGVGLVLLSLTNRYSGVVTRARALADSLRGEQGKDTHRIRHQLMILCRRARLLRLAIALASTSLLLAAFLVIALFLLELLGLEAALIIVVLFIACMTALSLGLIVFLVDVNMSLSALKLDVGVENTAQPET